MAKWGLAALLVFVAGCPPRGTPPCSAIHALQRVNNNLSKIDSVLYCPAFVSFTYRDEDGVRQSVPLSEAILFFQQPRHLLFEVRPLGEVIAKFGSDEEYYWLAIEETLWWGHWATIDRPSTRRLPVPPNELLDALMLRPLPERLGRGLEPLLRLDQDDHRLLFVRLGEDGEAISWREVRLQPHEPYQPVEIIDRLPDGQVLMHATLGNYRRIGDDGPVTARHYVVRWPGDDAELRLDITRARFRPDLENVDFGQRPSRWDGRVEQIDAPQDPAGLSGAEPDGMKRQ